jgi:hypothetical protein
MTSAWADEIIERGMKDRCLAFVDWSKMRLARFHCTDLGDFVVPKSVERATHFRKNGDIDRRFANPEWHEWLKQIGESE